MNTFQSARLGVINAALIIGLLVSGCFQSGRSYGEVSGSVEVVYGGTPVPDLEVKFYPNPDSNNDGPTAEGTTDSNGLFDLSTWRTERTGAIVGLHRVTFRQVQRISADLVSGTSTSKKNSLDKLPADVRNMIEKSKSSKVTTVPGQPKASVPREFADPFLTPFLNVEVKPGRQHLKFDLKEKTWNSEDLSGP